MSGFLQDEDLNYGLILYSYKPKCHGRGGSGGVQQLNNVQLVQCHCTQSVLAPVHCCTQGDNF